VTKQRLPSSSGNDFAIIITVVTPDSYNVCVS